MLTDDTKLKNQVDIYISMGKYNQAIDVLKEMLSNNPNNCRYLYLIGFCHHMIDKDEAALMYCYESLKNGSTGDCHYLLGMIYKKLSKLNKAKEHYLECLRINPLEASALSSLALIMLEVGNKKEALKYLKKAEEIDPLDIDVLCDILEFHTTKKNKKYQKEALQKFLENSQNEFDKLVALGVYNLSNNRFLKARDFFRQAYVLNPTNKTLLGFLEKTSRPSQWLLIPLIPLAKTKRPGIVLLMGLVALMIIANTPIIKGAFTILYYSYISYIVYIACVGLLLDFIEKHIRKK
ncbi:tetratricopeptide repeat protein [Clostridium sp. C8-1-8]|uniref:tetratricopeptide repeat protein n=1 Tax=Clostridium sp. C8-1-8 TaxID=2698831 RepID=UPI00136D697D|nr:tetratricopeptide repeat protein [Clostridium sp. C8-1-8]